MSEVARAYRTRVSVAIGPGDDVDGGGKSMRKPDVAIQRRSKHGWRWKRSAIPVSKFQIGCASVMPNL